MYECRLYRCSSVYGHWFAHVYPCYIFCFVIDACGRGARVCVCVCAHACGAAWYGWASLVVVVSMLTHGCCWFLPFNQPAASKQRRGARTHTLRPANAYTCNTNSAATGRMDATALIWENKKANTVHGRVAVWSWLRRGRHCTQYVRLCRAEPYYAGLICQYIICIKRWNTTQREREQCSQRRA